jgi:hypothetical protein
VLQAALQRDRADEMLRQGGEQPLLAAVERSAIGILIAGENRG